MHKHAPDEGAGDVHPKVDDADAVQGRLLVSGKLARHTILARPDGPFEAPW